MSSAEQPRRLSPERLAELRALGDASDAERARKQRVCAHPGDQRRNVTWGAVCGVCDARLA